MDIGIEQMINSRVQPLVQRILALVSLNKKSVLMPGGWAGEPGHAMAYEFKKDSVGNLIFLIFNSGSGLKFHENIPSIDKPRYRTVKSFQIPKEKVTQENLTYFMTELVKPTVMPFVTNRREREIINYNANILYNQVFYKIAYLNGEEISPDTLGQGYKNNASIGQRAGTCTEKVLHELTKNDIQDQKKAKLIIFCLKLYSMEIKISSDPAIPELGR